MSDDPRGGVLVEGYEDLHQIGRGGFATVYRARQRAFDRVVALKVLDLPDPDQTARDRFDRECRAIGALSWHPNIVVVHDSGVTADGRLYLAMEYLEAGSLADRVRAAGALPWADVVRAGIEVSGALDTAHAAGTLHRDLKRVSQYRLPERYCNASAGRLAIDRRSASGSRASSAPLNSATR